jgi:hypothetical protein
MRGSNRRQYFTESELARLIKAAKDGRYGHRDSTLILLMARHGLRVSEAVDLEWSQIDFTRAHLHRATPEGRDRVGASDPGQRVAGVARTASPAFVFASERGGPMTASTSQRWSRLRAIASELSASPFKEFWKSPRWARLQPSGGSSENVRAFSATPKELEVRSKFASTESHNRLGNDDPDLVGIFRGMGTEDRGRALAEREPAPTLQRTCRVATPPRHYSMCVLRPCRAP